MPDTNIARILEAARTIAVVGISSNPARPSNGVAGYLQRAGYRIIPVNPTLAGRELLGEAVAPALSAIQEPVDIVDVFRNSEAALETVRDAIREKDRLGIKTVWLQLGVVNETAAAEAWAAGLTVVMDRCIKIDHQRLVG